MNEKSLMPRITAITVCIIAIVSVLALYNGIALFLPFALFDRSTKTVVILIGFILIFSLFLFIYKRFISQRINVLSQNWLRYMLLAVVSSTLIFSLTYAHLPLYPINTKISINAVGPVVIRQVNAQLGNGQIQRLDLDTQLYGAWEEFEGTFTIVGSESGRIDLEGMHLSSGNMLYVFEFIPQSLSAEVKIDINGENFDLQIPSAAAHDGIYRFEAAVKQMPAATAFWQVWVGVLPYLRWLFLFVSLLLASLFIKFEQGRFWDWGLRYTLFLALSFLFYNALLFQNQFVNPQAHHIFWLLIALTAAVLIPMGMLWLVNKHPNAKAIFLVGIFLLAAGLRFYWVSMVPTGQVSDFADFHNWALQLAAGEPHLVMDRHVTFSRLVGPVYKVSPQHEIMEGINIIFSMLSIFSIWQIGKVLKQENAGIVGAYLFAIFPSQISMVTLVCSDIIAVGLLCLSALWMLLFLQRKTLIYLFLSGLVFGISLAIRSAMLIYLPLFLLIFYGMPQLKRLKATSLRVLLAVIGLTAGFLSIKGIASTIRVPDMHIAEERSVIIPLLNGTNINALGRFNFEDEALAYSWEEDSILRNGFITIYERVIKNPVGFYELLKHKFAYNFGDGTYGEDHAFLGADMDYSTFKTGWNYEAYDIRGAFALLSQYTYWVVLGLALTNLFVKPDEHKSLIGLMALIITISAIAAYTFFEVQPRYQRPIIPFIILMAAYALTKLTAGSHKSN